jgi:spermidine synthase
VGWLLRYRLLVFVASFLLFSIELLIGRMLLPAFGSGAQVWASCLVFFQVTLFVGYLYAERAQRWIAQGRHRWLHRAVVLVPLLAFPLRVVRFGESPALAVLIALAASVGLPFFALSTTSVVAQAWLSRSAHPRRDDPYFLYGTSNAGALAALVLYPLVIEPGFDLGAQRIGWYVGYAVYVALVFLGDPAAGAGELPAMQVVRAPWRRRAVWILLPAGANALLMACTNAVTIDAAVPLVWTLPLIAYLLTLVICFGPTPVSERTLRLVSGAGLTIAALATWALSSGRSVQASVLVLHLCVLFVACLLLHRAVSRARPEELAQLGTYYRDLALGGCVGGALVGLGAPILFRHAALPALDYVLALGLILPGLLVRDLERWRGAFAGRPGRVVAVGALALLVVAATAGAVVAALRARVESVRTFYGLYTVTDDGARRWFRHGNTFHGVEQLAAPDEPLAYYDRGSPIGRVLATRELVRRRVGVVGLGIGTLAAYGRADERWDFFELDPEVVRIAREDFHFLGDSAAKVSIVPGDARLTLASVPDRQYDLLVLDAFNSDFVPLHLVTREAVELYLRKLAPGGVIACHVSNRLFRLAPELVRIAREEGLSAAFGSSERSEAEAAQGHYASEWLLLARDPEQLRVLSAAANFHLVTASLAPARAWSDDYVNLIRAIRR